MLAVETGGGRAIPASHGIAVDAGDLEVRELLLDPHVLEALQSEDEQGPLFADDGVSGGGELGDLETERHARGIGDRLGLELCIGRRGDARDGVGLSRHDD